MADKILVRKENAIANAEANKKRVKVVIVDTPFILDEENKLLDFTCTGKLASWLVREYRGREIEITDDGQVVKFFRGGLEDSVKRRGEVQRLVYVALERLLESSVYSGYELGDERHPRVDRQKIYYAAAMVGNEIFGIRFKIDIHIGEQYGRYKDHKAVKVKIKRSLSLYRGQTPMGGVPQNESDLFIPVSEIKTALGILH